MWNEEEYIYGDCNKVSCSLWTAKRDLLQNNI